MWAPLTPTLQRKSSLKKIIIASPSLEMAHFLSLPNPSAAEDPRQRIHILTPHRHRSLSRTHLPLSPVQEKPKSCGLKRDCFIRKRTQQASWKKAEVPFKAQKLQIKSSEQRVVSSLCSSQAEHPQERSFDFTFGADTFGNCVKV
jgi:hypothetical protein